MPCSLPPARVRYSRDLLCLGNHDSLAAERSAQRRYPGARSRCETCPKRLFPHMFILFDEVLHPLIPLVQVAFGLS